MSLSHRCGCPSSPAAQLHAKRSHCVSSSLTDLYLNIGLHSPTYNYIGFLSMIPAAPFNAKDRLRRAKSSRSIRKARSSILSPETLDIESVRHQATAAAACAMLRSSERSSTDSRSSYDRLGGPGSVAVPQRRHPRGNRYVDDSSSVGHGPSPMYTSRFCPSDADFVEPQDHYQALSAALPPISEFQGLDGGPSVPSSYRRLRKSKSMFSTRHRRSHATSTTSPDYNGNTAAAYDGQWSTPRSFRTLTRSKSFLRSGSRSTRVIRRAKSHDAAIELARSQFLQNSEEQQMQRRHSSLLPIKPRREHKPFRKTFRIVSEPGLDTIDAPTWLGPSRNGGLNSKARSLSHSIKNGIKRLLRLSKPAGSQTSTYGPSSPRLSWENGGSVGSTTYTGYGLGEQSSNDDSACHDRHPTIRSIRSSESICTSNSRVTSWTDSTAANTIATRRATDRLSIIQGNGNTTRQLSQLTPNNSPSCLSYPCVRSGASKPDISTDGQRLYSALMKRIGRESMERPDEGIVLGTVKEHHPIPQRANSVYSHRSKRTVRRVSSDESIDSPRSFATATGNTPSVRHQLSKMPNIHREGSSSLTPQQRTSYRDTQSQGLSTHTILSRKSRYSLAQQTDHFENSALRKESSDEFYVNGDNFDGGYAAARPNDHNQEPDSPSVYSRTTGANTPADENIGLDPDILEPEEPGMATIFESTPYSSPRRTARSTSYTATHPSSDWQQWVNSQMARIDELGPARRDHYREDAQIQDNETDSIFSAIPIKSATPSTGQDSGKGLSRQLSISSKISGRSNFSRPFNRSPSVRTIISPQKFPASAAIIPSSTSPPSPSPIRSSVVGPAGQPFSIPPLSPMRTRLSNAPQLPESPTPKREAATAQRMWANEQYGRYPRRPPFAQDAKAVQFRSLRASRDNRRTTNENVKNEQKGGGGITEGHNNAQDIHSTVSSKRMVEMFLNSRRRQMGSEVSEDSTTEAAFI